MSDQALAVIPKSTITIGGKSLEQVADTDLVEQTFREFADRLVLRAEAIEIIGSERVQVVAAGVLTDLSKFIKERNDAADSEVKPFKTAMQRIKDATEKLLADAVKEKARIGNLLGQFATRQRLAAEEAQRKQAAEVKRIQAEAAELERKKQELAAEQARLNAAPAAPATTAAAVAVEEQQQALDLQQAELNRQAAEASKTVEVPKVEGLATTTKWTFKLVGENEAEWKGSMVKALLVHPDWFDIKPKVRVIEAALKEAAGKLEVPGMTFFEETKARPT